ncbi:MAG: hypothetical protein WB607_19525, partial [Candidatus Acidiferrum sp.]
PPPRPHLKVAVASIVRTDIQSAKMLVFSTAFICALFGAILLVVAYFAWRGRSAEADFGSGLQPLNSSQRE